MSLVSPFPRSTSRTSGNYCDKFSLFRQYILTCIIVLFCTFVGTCPALAGIYKVTYSGGKFLSRENGHATTILYSQSGNTYGAWGTCGCNTDTSGSIVGIGQITATFTFVADPSIPKDAPPPAVVVLENCQAQVTFHGGSSADVTGVSADDDLGFPDDHGYIGTYLDSASSGTPSGPIGLYKIVQNPGYSFTVTCSPKVTASLAQPGGQPQGAATALGRLIFQASASPLMVNLGGGIGSQFYHQYLIGQDMDDTLLTGGLTPSNFHWKIAGGCKPFVSWKLSNYVYNRSSIIQTNNPSSGSVLWLNRDIKARTASTLNCNPELPESSAKAECKVDLAVPKGANPKGGFHGTTVKSISFSVWNPLSPHLQIEPGSVNIKNHEIMGLLKYATDTFILMNVTTPPAFTNNGQTTGFYAWLQEVTPNRSYVDSSGVTHTLTNNGRMGLDNKWVFIAHMADGIHPIDGTDTDYLINSTAYDGPEMGVPQNARSMHATDRYHDWLMYQPPSGTWVPVYDGTWQWSGTAVNLNNVWKLTKSSCTAKAGVINPPFPVWNFLWTYDPGLITYK